MIAIEGSSSVQHVDTRVKKKKNKTSPSPYSVLLMMLLSIAFQNKCAVQVRAFTLRTTAAYCASTRTIIQTTVNERIRRGGALQLAPSSSSSSSSSISSSLNSFSQPNNILTQSTPYIILSNTHCNSYSTTSIQAASSSSAAGRRSKYQQEPPEPNPELDSLIQEATSTNDFFASTSQFPSFESIGVQSPILLDRVNSFLKENDNGNDSDNGDLNLLPKPSAIQAASYKAIQSLNDVTIGAETGSGKTLAYLLPIIDDILQAKLHLKNNNDGNDNGNDNDKKKVTKYDYARAIILVPNKELANQVIRMATPLCGGTECIIWGTNGEQQFHIGQSNNNNNDNNNDHEMVRIGFLPGELKTPEDYKPIRNALNDPSNNPPLDIIVCTPASLGPWGLNPKNINIFADIKTLIIDEADMLFDGGYLRQLENVLLGFRRADKLDPSFGVEKTQHVLVAATLPSMGTKSVDAYVQRKFPFATRVTMSGMHNARHYGLGQQTVWVEDEYDEMMPKKVRMERLVQMIKAEPSESESERDGNDHVGLKGEKIMVFLNNVNDVDSATNALRRSGIEAVPFHAKMPLAVRTENLARFRKFVAGEQEQEDAVSVLVCTDLAARGLDIPGVTAVVQLQFAGNVVTHLHRMGRCGRAGNRDGRGVIFYGGVESELVEVVIEAEQQQETMILKGNDIEDMESDGEEGEDKEKEKGKVQAAFSRKRGFTRKRKKLRKAAREEQEDDSMYFSD